MMEWFMLIPVFVIAAFIGGWISRMCGGASPGLPWGLQQWLYALPYAVLVAPVSLWWVLPAYLAAVMGKRTGHGGGMDLGTSTKARDPEKLEYLILPLHGRIPEYWYDALLLALTGLAVTLVPGIVLAAYGHIATGLIIAASGLLKAPAYMIGWAIFPTAKDDGDFWSDDLDEATEIGEFLTGFFGWGMAAVIAYMMFIVEVL